MKMSVLVSSFNRANTLPRLINSILNTQNNDIELVIVDDDSRDDTEKLMSTYTDDRIIYLKK